MHAITDVIRGRAAVLGGMAGRQRRALLIGTLAAAVALSTQGASALAPSPVSVRGEPSAALPAPPADADPSAGLRLTASGLQARAAGNPGALAQQGQVALAGARNAVTIAAFLKLRWAGRYSAWLEHYAADLTSADPSRLALALAGVQYYSGLIHNGLLNDGPERLITVSLQDQRLVAYEKARIVVDTPVTTGRATLPTDVGAMRVLKKDAPWTMHSPWPKGSPYWYPDTVVQMVVWFTRTGEGMHDASWQPPGSYGPGSTDGPYASHGCIHVPFSAETTLFNWAPLGTPVVVYPGDGAPMAEQAAQRTVDAAGSPVSGSKGA